MKTVSRKIYLYWKKITTPYALANKQHLVEINRVLGSTLKASNKMISYSEENKEFMKEVIGLSPNSPHWDTMLANYWHSLSIDIPNTGKELEIGFVYDITNASKKQFLDSYNSSVSESSKLKTTDDVVNYFKKEYNNIIESAKRALIKAESMPDKKTREAYISNIYKTKYTKIEELETQKYKFGNPIDVADYILYRYALIHSEVANEFNLVDKSNNIRFYLHSEDEIKEIKEMQLAMERSRMEKLKEVLAKRETIDSILYAAKYGDKIKDLDDTGRDLLLMEYSSQNPKDFIKFASDGSIKIKGLIEKYIVFGILNRLESSSVIVSATDSSIIVGNSMEEAIAFFNNTKENKQVLSEFEARFKGLPK